MTGTRIASSTLSKVQTAYRLVARLSKDMVAKHGVAKIHLCCILLWFASHFALQNA